MTFQTGYSLSLILTAQVSHKISTLVLCYPSTMALAAFPRWKGCKSLSFSSLIKYNPELWIQLKSHLVHKPFLTSKQEGIFLLIKVPQHTIFVTFVTIVCLAKVPFQMLFKSCIISSLSFLCHLSTTVPKGYWRKRSDILFAQNYNTLHVEGFGKYLLIEYDCINYRSILVKFSFSFYAQRRAHEESNFLKLFHQDINIKSLSLTIYCHGWYLNYVISRSK